MEKPIVDTYVLFNEILNDVRDVNDNRRENINERVRRWIFPTIPTSNDSQYPRISVTISNISYSKDVQTRQSLIDNFNNSEETVKTSTSYVGMTFDVNVGLYIKKEVTHRYLNADGTFTSSKNNLLGSLIFEELLDVIDRNTSRIKELSFEYHPNNITSTWNFENESNKIAYLVTIPMVVLRSRTRTYGSEEIITEISSSISDDTDSDVSSDSIIT